MYSKTSKSAWFNLVQCTFGNKKVLFCALVFTEKAVSLHKITQKMDYKQEEIDRLKTQVESVAGRKISSPKDFDFLCHQVEGYTSEHLSVSTLKRVWGYVSSDSGISKYSLDVLARMVGYVDWTDFAAKSSEEDGGSHRIVRRKLMTSSLSHGDIVRLTWRPDRVVTVRYEGQDLFTVVTSENSKLQPDDTFHCLMIVEHEQLYLCGLYRKGTPPCDYVCGKNGGVMWNIVEE